MTTATGLTAKQAAVFWSAFARACREQGIARQEEREAYRKRVLMEECGVEHMSQVTRTDGFEQVMRRLLVDCGDYEGAVQFTNGPERRKAHMVEVCAEQVMQLMGVSPEYALGYVTGLCLQAHFAIREESGNYWLDLPEGDVAAAFQMLDTHRRRLLKVGGWTGALSFDVGAAYTKTPSGIAMQASAPAKPSAFRVKPCTTGGVG